MLTRVPDHFSRFHCLAGACPHTCCTGWEVVIDEETAGRYAVLPGPLGEKLRRVLRRDKDGDLCFALDRGRCPFLDGEGLCELQRFSGDRDISETCREHPRFCEDYGAFREIALAASCPAANALLLETDRPLSFLTGDDGEEAEEGDPWLAGLLPLRQRMMDILEERQRSMGQRLGDILLLAGTAQSLLDEDRGEALAELAEQWTGAERVQTAEHGLFPAGFALLAGLESMEPGWEDLLAAAETAKLPVLPEGRLERIGTYFLFRYVLKAVNDGDLLGRVQLCIFALLTVRRLAGACGLGEALRRFSCEIEHSEENLETLLETFRWETGYSVEAFLQELSAI